MRFNPADAKESGGSFKPGLYRFKVINAEEAVSQSGGNEMIKLTLNVNIDGQDVNVFDHLVNTARGLWKPKMFCAEVGLDFSIGELTARMCMNKSGRVQLDYDPKDIAKVNTGTLGRAYLKVVRYGVHEEKQRADNAEVVSQDAGSQDGDEDVPF